MSSVLPSRRPQRTTRTAISKDSENANARPSRATTRAKPPSTGLGTSNAVNAKAKPGDTKDTMHKRKREAFGDVTHNRENAHAGVVGKGKVKETAKKFDGVVINKGKLPANTTTNAIRQPLRTRQTARNGAILPAEEKETERIRVQPSDDAMVVDPPGPKLHSLTVRKSVVAEEASDVTLTRAGSSKVLVSRTTTLQVTQEEDENEAGPALKKRRTSSEAPEDAFDEEEEDEEDRRMAEVRAQIRVKVDAMDELEEAQPDGDDWEDLDAEDEEDPLMVSEYVVEIFEYLKKIEVATMPSPNYMANQKELGWSMRGILADWLIELHTRMRLLPETLYLCMNLIDRFLSTRVVSLAKLQLVGVTTMFIAAKVEEILAPAAINFVHEADGVYTEADMFQAEKYILKTLDWNLNFPNPMHYLRRISKADSYDTKGRTLAKYLLEIGCVEWRLIAAPPSLMAAAALWLARMMLGNEEWTPNLAHYSSYPESAIIPTANLMINYILKPIRHEMFHKKYAGKKYLKVSVVARNWCRSRWEENTQVNLPKELPAIKRVLYRRRLETEAFGLPLDDEDDTTMKLPQRSSAKQ